jgi:hypothetical protein
MAASEVLSGVLYFGFMSSELIKSSRRKLRMTFKRTCLEIDFGSRGCLYYVQHQPAEKGAA